MDALEVISLSILYDDVIAVSDVSFKLSTEQYCCLLGPSGCGKTSTLRAIAGHEVASAGDVIVGGQNVTDLAPARRPTSMMFQDYALFPHLTVADNIGFGLRDHRTDERQTRIDELLQLVDLAGFGDRFPHELSGGERQRVALARVLAPSPALMLFDEPFASLDHNLRIKLRHDVAAALKATGTPAVFVTHDQQEALAIGDRIAVMRNGRIRQLGTPAEVYHQPVDDFVAAFMGTASFLPIANDATTVLGPIDLDGAAPADAVAMVRPDDIVFTASATGEAEIVGAAYHGSGWHLHARVHDGVDVYFTVGHLDAPAVGDRGTLALTPGHCQVVVPRR